METIEEPAVNHFSDQQPAALQINERQDRHLCPACPAGAGVKPLGTEDPNRTAQYCCARRKTMTKTIKSTKTKTITTTYSKTAIAGLLFVDMNGDRKFGSGDLPISNSAVSLVALGPVRGKNLQQRSAPPACWILANATTNQFGKFAFILKPNVLESGVEYGISNVDKCRSPVAAFRGPVPKKGFVSS